MFDNLEAGLHLPNSNCNSIEVIRNTRIRWTSIQPIMFLIISINYTRNMGHKVTKGRRQNSINHNVCIYKTTFCYLLNLRWYVEWDTAINTLKLSSNFHDNINITVEFTCRDNKKTECCQKTQ